MSNTALPTIATHLALKLFEDDGALFPQATVYDSAGSLDATVNLSHVATGLYTVAHTFATADEWDVVFIVYTDGAHTIRSTVHGDTSERWEVAEDLWARALPASFAAGTAGFRLADVDGRIPAALVTGRIDASVGAVTTVALDSISDGVWDEDVVAAHGSSDTSGLLLRALGGNLSQRANNADLDSLMGVPDSAGATVVSSVSQIDVVQAWSRSLGPETLHGIVTLHQNGESVVLPGGAMLAVQAYDQLGVPLFSQAGISPTVVGSDTWFGVDEAFVLTAGAVISIRVTITGSGVGSGTHVNPTQVVTPEF